MIMRFMKQLNVAKKVYPISRDGGVGGVGFIENCIKRLLPSKYFVTIKKFKCQKTRRRRKESIKLRRSDSRPIQVHYVVCVC